MPHKEDFTEFTPDRYPPFPTDLPTVTLDTLSLRLLERQDPTEQARAVHAFKTRGFVYLDLAGTDHGATLLTGATHIAQAAERTFRLPLAEKLAYKPGPRDLFGFKSQGATNADKSGTPDTAEFFNVSKDDMLAPSPRRPWPQHILDDLPLFRAYILAAHATGLLILDLLARHLGIDPAEIQRPPP
ncbi:putative iron ascorbate-dependent oxidoreductase family protein, partial [Teratosphaeria destructans]